MVAFQSEDNIVLEISELSKEYFRILNLNGPTIVLEGNDRVEDLLTMNIQVSNGKNSTQFIQKVEFRPSMNRLNFQARTNQVLLKNEKNYTLSELFSRIEGNIFQIKVNVNPKVGFFTETLTNFKNSPSVILNPDFRCNFKHKKELKLMLVSCTNMIYTRFTLYKQTLDKQEWYYDVPVSALDYDYFADS